MDESERLSVLNLQRQLIESQTQSAVANRASTLFNQDEKENIIKFILDPTQILLRIEQLLRQQVATRDKDGNLYFKDPEEKDKLLNDKGVKAILEILSWYITPEVILSNYKEEEVDKIMYNFSIQFVDTFYTQMEDWGLDTKDKQKNFDMISTNIINIVDATYHRSIGGKALESLSKSIMVTQSDSLNKGFNIPNKSNFKLTKPSTWI